MVRIQFTWFLQLLTKTAYNNNLRTRSLLAFIAVVMQIPAGWALQAILDDPGWGRRKRGLVGLTSVAVPLVIAWVWEMVSIPRIWSSECKLIMLDPHPQLRSQRSAHYNHGLG
jgi:ABC-type sugar transport system permease subunit